MTSILPFSLQWYLKNNPDVADAVSKGLIDAFWHFETHGKAEGRSPAPLFNTQEYLSKNPDVAAAVARGETTAYDHFVTFGAGEGRAPLQMFDTAFYLSKNADVAAAVQAGIMTAVEHFLRHGQSEPRQFNVSIDLGAYLRANPDVAKAVEDGFMSGMDHLLQYGAGEGRNLGNGVDLLDFAKDPAFTDAIAAGNYQGALDRVGEVAPFLSTFVKPTGWTPAADTPIPVTFVPVAGQKLVIPAGVIVPEGMTLPDTFIPVTPPVVVPPVEPPVAPPADVFSVSEVAGEITFIRPGNDVITIMSLGDPVGDFRVLTVIDGASKSLTVNVSVNSAFVVAAGQTLTVSDQLISQWSVKGAGNVLITSGVAVGTYDLTAIVNTGTLTLPVLAAGHTLILTSAQVSGKVITGAGAVQVASLDATTDLSGIATPSLSTKVINDMTFTGHFGKALVTVETGKVLTVGDSAIMSGATIKVDGELQGNASVLKGLSAIIGKVTVLDTGPVLAADLNAIKATTSGLVTATATATIIGSAAELSRVLVTDKVATALAVAVNVNDATGFATELVAPTLSDIGAATTGLVTVMGAVSISGTAAQLKAALVTDESKVQATISRVTVTDAISLADLAALDAATIAPNDIIFSTIADTSAALALNAGGYLAGTKAASITDAAGTAITAQALSAIKAMTTGTVTVSNVLAISGTSAELKAALVDADTKVIAPKAVVTVTDLDGTEITAQALNAIGALSNTVKVINAVSISGNTAQLKTALLGKPAKVSAPDALVTVTDAIKLTDLWMLKGANTKGIVYSTVTDRWVNLQADEGRHIGGDVAVIITDVAGTAITPQTLSTIKALTTGEVTVSNALALSGTAAQLKAALVTESTKVIAPTAIVTVTDAISLADLALLDAATTATNDIVFMTIADTVAALTANVGGYVSGDKAVTITDANGTAFAATALSAIGAATKGAVTVANGVVISGTTEQLKAALYYANTKVIAPNAVVTVTDAISFADLKLLDDSTAMENDIGYSTIADISPYISVNAGGYIRGDKNVTILDDAIHKLPATTISNLATLTTGTITVANAVGIMGSLSEVKAALGPDAPTVVAGSAYVMVGDNADMVHGQTYDAKGSADTIQVSNIRAATDMSKLTGFETVTLTGDSDGTHLVTLANDAVTITATDAVTVLLGTGGQTFIGSAKNDKVFASSGSDTVVFKYATGVDTIVNFEFGVDKIQISKSAFAAVGDIGALHPDQFFGVMNFTDLGAGGTGSLENTTHTHALIYVDATKGLYYNADGATPGGLTLIATFDGVPELQQGMFTVIA